MSDSSPPTIPPSPSVGTAKSSAADALQNWKITDVALAVSQHRVFLFLSMFVLILSAVLNVPGSTAVVIPGLQFELPGLCMFRRVVGMDCPGCGLTRSFICLAHGDFARAWQFNPGGIPFFVLVAAQIPYRVWQLLRLRRGLLPIDLGAWGLLPLLLIVGLLLVQWLAKLVLFAS